MESQSLFISALLGGLLLPSPTRAEVEARISSAEADLDNQLLFIHGASLPANAAPVVTRGDSTLRVDAYSSSDIVAVLPANLEPAT